MKKRHMDKTMCRSKCILWDNLVIRSPSTVLQTNRREKQKHHFALTEVLSL